MTTLASRYESGVQAFLQHGHHGGFIASHICKPLRLVGHGRSTLYWINDERLVGVVHHSNKSRQVHPIGWYDYIPNVPDSTARIRHEFYKKFTELAMTISAGAEAFVKHGSHGEQLGTFVCDPLYPGQEAIVYWINDEHLVGVLYPDLSAQAQPFEWHRQHHRHLIEPFEEQLRNWRKQSRPKLKARSSKRKKLRARTSVLTKKKIRRRLKRRG